MTMAVYPWIIHVLLVSSTYGESLFRTSPGGDGIKAAGLWGGHVTLTQNGQAENLHSHGYESLNTSYTSYHGIQIDYVSYDPISKRTLIAIEDPDASTESTQQALAIGTLCESGHNSLQATFQNFKLVDSDNAFFMDDDCSWKCGWGPFAFYDNKIYFVLSAVFGEHFSALQRQIQIRVIDGCDDVIESMHNQRSRSATSLSEFHILQCSTHVTTLYTQDYAKPSPTVNAWTTSELKVTYANGRLHFFTQLINNEAASTPRLDLYHSLSNSSVVIASSDINSIFAGNLRARGFGSVDYANGVLCWTSGHTLHCGLYNLDTERPYVVPILEPGRVVSENICSTGKKHDCAH